MSVGSSNGHGGRVRRTGIALVHAGELVLPAAGSEAQAEAVVGSDRTAVHYHFPVEIEVVRGGQAIDGDALADLALERLRHGLEASQD